MPQNKNLNQPATILKTSTQTTAIVNGQRVEASSAEYLISAGNKILHRQDGFSIPPPGASLNLSAFNMLSSLGVTLAPEKKTYSLLGDQTNTQTLENISIFDPIYNTLTNTPVEAIDKFSNNKDPFYELDDAPPADETKRREEIIETAKPNVENLTTELVRNNLKASTKSTLKQFVNERDTTDTERSSLYRTETERLA